MAVDYKPIVDKLEKRLQMMWQTKRFETFKSWRFGKDTPCSAHKLAEAGFFFTGSSAEPDAVQCFLCDKALDGWDEDDDPWAEHLSHSANCAFAILGQPEEALTFQQLSEFQKKLAKKQMETALQNVQDIINRPFNLRLNKLKRALKNVKFN